MSKHLLQYRHLVLLATALLLAASLYLIPRLEANYQFEDFFPKGDPQVAYFEKYADTFGSDEHLLMVAFQRTSSVFEIPFLEQFDSLSTLLEQRPTVHSVLGINNFQDWIKTPFGVVGSKILNIKSGDFKKVKIRCAEDPRIHRLLINSEQTIVSLLLELSPGLTESAGAQLIDFIKKESQNLGLPEPRFGGQINTETGYIQMIESENVKLIPIFLLAVILVLLLIYRSFLSILIPTMSVLIGLILLYGYAALIGRDINLSTLMYPTIMAVVGMSDLIHLYTKYQHELLAGKDKQAAILIALRELRTTLLLTSVTTIIGFLSISWSSIPHIQSFGLDAAVGVFLAYVIAITLTPVLLSYLPVPKAPKNGEGWQRLLGRIATWTISYRNTILATTLLLLVLSIIGIRQIDTNNYILGAIDDDAQIKKDFLFFEQEFSGVRSFELVLEPQNGHQINDAIVLKEIEKIELYLNQWSDLGPLFSPLTYYKSVNDFLGGGRFSNYQLPDSFEQNANLEKWRSRIRDPFTNKELTRGRITAKMKDIGRLDVKEKLAALNQWATTNTNQEVLRFQPTGIHLLVDRTNELMIGKLASGLLIAFFLIAIIVGVLFRNAKMVIISLIPNILPLIITAGIMGYIGVELNGSTAIIFTIAFVIAVDDSIHFLKKFQQEFKISKDKEMAILATLQQAGKGIIITSLILVGGYAVLFFSEFKEAYYHGVLICFTLVWALLADLFLIPILLRAIK